MMMMEPGENKSSTNASNNQMKLTALGNSSSSTNGRGNVTFFNANGSDDSPVTNKSFVP
jgi:hypothetical protein